jgi:pimeloyl-ACP methyl ester carboxylesterase
MLAKHGLEGAALYCDLFVGNVNVTVHLEGINVPTLILASRNSMASPLSLNQQMTARIRGSRLASIGSVGHMQYIDESKKISDAILKWVKAVQG